MESTELPLEDDQVIRNFNSSHRQVDGWFMIQLPRRRGAPKLGSTRSQALRRLLSNERSLKAKDRLEEFHTVLREHITRGHAEVIPESELHRRPHFYLPVHAVFKDSSTTTNLRAVSDASVNPPRGLHSMIPCFQVPISTLPYRTS